MGYAIRFQKLSTCNYVTLYCKIDVRLSVSECKTDFNDVSLKTKIQKIY